MEEAHYHHHRRLEVSPLFIGLLGVIAGAIIVAIFHCAVYGCRATHRQPEARNVHRPAVTRQGGAPGGAIVNNTAAAQRYGKDCGGEETCAVCLSEFEEGEEVRVLRECAHIFHVSCIDMWLFSHTSCPLCRADVTATVPPPPHVAVSMPDSGGIPPPEL